MKDNMNNLDKKYTDLLQDILDNGVRKEDRTGTGTLSVFGRTIRHKMSEGFPLLTTKKMYWKGIVTELLWFLRGDTNIKYLVDNDCHIWDGDAYKAYEKSWEYAKSLQKQHSTDEDYQQYLKEIDILSQEEFINKIKTDDEFAKKWGELGPVYGKQWRSWNNDKYGLKSIGNEVQRETNPNLWRIPTTYLKHEQSIDQIQNLIRDLKTNPDSRRLMVNAWNVGELDQMTLPPCHYGFQVYTRELSDDEIVHYYYKHIKPEQKYQYNKDTDSYYYYDEDSNIWFQHSGSDILLGMRPECPKRAISLMWNQRSVDTFLGLPFNIASYGLLLEIIAKEVNMVPDELIGNLGDTHLYLNHIEQAKEQIGREFTEEEIQEHLQQSGMDALKYEPRMEYISKLPKRTREPYPLPKLMICGDMTRTDSFTVPFDELDHSLIKLIDYQSHPTIKAPLSN